MSHDHPEWIERVLAHDGGDDDEDGTHAHEQAAERAAVAAHLETCASCRVLLQRVREAERAPHALGEIPAEILARPPLSAAESAAADQSLQALRVRLTPRGRIRRNALRAPRWLWVAAPLAAAALILLLLRPQTQALSNLQRVAVVDATQARGGNNPGDVSPRASWRTGEAIALSLQLAHPGYVVVFQVEPGGQISLLYPPDPAQPAVETPANTAVVVPDPGGYVRWVLQGEPGTETLLVAAPQHAPADLQRVAAEATRLAGVSGRRELAVSRLKALLEQAYGPVSVQLVDHRP